MRVYNCLGQWLSSHDPFLQVWQSAEGLPGTLAKHFNPSSPLAHTHTHASLVLTLPKPPLPLTHLSSLVAGVFCILLASFFLACVKSLSQSPITREYTLYCRLVLDFKTLPLRNTVPVNWRSVSRRLALDYDSYEMSTVGMLWEENGGSWAWMVASVWASPASLVNITCFSLDHNTQFDGR